MDFLPGEVPQNFIATMQKVKKVAGILVIALFYCISAGFVNTNYDNAGNAVLSKAGMSAFSSVAPLNMHCHTVPGDNQVKTISSMAAKFIRIDFCNLSVIGEHICCTTEQQSGRSISCVTGFLIQQHKRFIMFPFHNFW